jgi:transcriptional regulator with XRE-family HTH domain
MHEIDRLALAFLEKELPEDEDARRTVLTKIAAKIGVTLTHLQYILNGKRNLGTKTAEKLASCFGRSHLELLQEGYRIVYGAPKATPGYSPVASPTVLILSEVNNKPDVPLQDYYAAPLIDGTIAAGEGRIIGEGETSDPSSGSMPRRCGTGAIMISLPSKWTRSRGTA